MQTKPIPDVPNVQPLSFDFAGDRRSVQDVQCTAARSNGSRSSSVPAESLGLSVLDYVVTSNPHSSFGQRHRPRGYVVKLAVDPGRTTQEYTTQTARGAFWEDKRRRLFLRAWIDWDP